ncbi:MAG: TIGR02530 family flagellar biosynthesis protein [Bacteroides sp.]|nr:flagellar protein [Clostridia bacterium]
MQVNSGKFSSIEQVTGQYLGNSRVHESRTTDSTFLDILNRTRQDIESSKTSELKFSKHAGERLADRNITLTEEQLSRLEDGAHKASAKGIKESLVLMDGMAFIVNTKNNMVITAMNQSGAEENIYTNIDGAVII